MPKLKKDLIHVGLLCAMPEEIGSTLKNIKNISQKKFGDLHIFSGEWIHPNDSLIVFVTLAWSGWGKVSSARAATRILDSKIEGKSVDFLIFTGVAGAAKSDLNQWDIIIPNELVQHDMDARPIFEKYIIPTLKISRITTSKSLLEWAYNSIKTKINNNQLRKFGVVEKGLVATGDKFISDKLTLGNLTKEFPELCAVEMEGAAVAQVAFQEDLPWLILRVISDNADHSASQNFVDFLEDYKKFSWNLIESLFLSLDKLPLLK